jgi:hypothetical protein
MQRNENFDNKGGTDTASNTYNLSFTSNPIQTLDATLSLVRSERYNFNEKESTNDSYLINIGAYLHRDVHMITDFGFNRSKSFVSDTTTSNYFINGTIDAILTKKLSTDVSYSFDWTSTDDTSSESKDGSMFITYRPGRFINLTGDFSISDNDGEISTSEGVLIDWLPLPAVRLNINYQHERSNPGPVTRDTFSSFSTWHITKFMSAQLTYSYVKTDDQIKKEANNITGNLNVRF